MLHPFACSLSRLATSSAVHALSCHIARTTVVFESSPNAAEVIRSVKRERATAAISPCLTCWTVAQRYRPLEARGKRMVVRALSTPRRTNPSPRVDVPAHSSALRMEILGVYLCGAALSPEPKISSAFGLCG